MFMSVNNGVGKDCPITEQNSTCSVPPLAQQTGGLHCTSGEPMKVRG